MKLIKFLVEKLIKFLVENDWTPASLLTTTTFRLLNPNEHWGEHNRVREFTERTKLGKWVDSQTGIVGLNYTILHYLVVTPIWVVCFLLFGFGGIIYDLCTKSWGDI